MKNMKKFSTFLILPCALVVFACKGEMSGKPDAQVTEVSSTTVATETATPVAQPTSTAQVIKEKSKIDFVGAKVTEEEPGTFKTFDGRIEYAGKVPSRIIFEIDTASVKTKSAKLDEHLKSSDFFDAAKHPKATFTSTSIKESPTPKPGAETHVISGTLDMHGIQKEVSFPANIAVTPQGIHAISQFKINRHDWKVSYAGAPDNLIKDDVLIKLDLRFPPPPAG